MKKLALLITFYLLFTNVINAQYQYDEDLIHDIILDPENGIRIESGDFDNDGDIDLLEFFFNGSKLIWFENVQARYHTFRPIKLSDSLYIYNFAVGDMDNDGDLDIVTAGNYYAIFTNDGYGNFEEYIFYENNEDNSITFIALGDLDSDNRIDIVLMDKNRRDIQWFKNQGNSPFDLKSTRIKTTVDIDRSETTLYSFYVMDFDKNGTNDIIINNRDLQSNPYWYSNDGRANFTEQPFVTESRKIGSFLIVDVDNDGFNDVVGESVLGQSCFRFDGSNSLDYIYPIGIPYESLPTASADFNGDGHADLIYRGSYSEPNLVCYLNDGAQTFTSSDTIGEDIHCNVLSTLPIDFDNDGDLDLVVACVVRDQIYIFENNGFGKFEIKQRLLDNTTNEVAFSMADSDNDGDLDAFYNYYSMYFIENRGNGAFDSPEKLSNLYAETVEAVDLNNDGFIDVFGGNWEYLYWLKNKGSNEFSDPIIIDSLFGGFHQTQIADIDGNGYQDLLIRDYNSSTSIDDSLFCYPNSENGFDDGKILIEPDSVKVFTNADMNNDGLTDLLIGHSNLSLYLYSNNGNFDFEIIKLDDNIEQVSLATADLNNDGKNDVLSYYFDYNDSKTKIGWFENLGGNSFGSVKNIFDDFSYQTFVNGVGIVTSDVNLDGFVDVILFRSDDGTLFTNKGDGTFSVNELFFGSNSTLAHDMDKDGDPDFVMSFYWNSFFWYENRLNSTAEYSRTICMGDSIQFYDRWYSEEGIYTEVFSNANGGADSVYLILDVDDDFPSKPELNGLKKCTELDVVDYSIESDAFTDYYWNVNGGKVHSITNQTQAKIEWVQLGVGTIDIYAVSTKSGCKTLSSFTIEVDKISNDNIVIYPNPAGSTFTVTPTIDLVNVEVIDALGRTVMITTNEQPINVSALRSGIFIVLLKDGSGNEFGLKKLVVE